MYYVEYVKETNEYLITIGDYTYTHDQLKNFYKNLHRVEHFLDYWKKLDGDIYQIDVWYLKITERRLLYNFLALMKSGYHDPELTMLYWEVHRCWLVLTNEDFRRHLVFVRGAYAIKGYMQYLDTHDIYPPKYLPRKSFIRWFFGRVFLREYGKYQWSDKTNHFNKWVVSSDDDFF